MMTSFKIFQHELECDVCLCRLTLPPGRVGAVEVCYSGTHTPEAVLLSGPLPPTLLAGPVLRALPCLP